MFWPTVRAPRAELGNEQNTNYSPRQAAAYFKVLSDLLIELWPEPMTRPKIIGPDVHGRRVLSFHRAADKIVGIDEER